MSRLKLLLHIAALLTAIATSSLAIAAVDITVYGGNPAESINASPRVLTGDSSYFTVVSLHATSDEAMDALARVRAAYPDLSLAVFPHIPGSAGQWALVSAAFVAKLDAEAQLAILQTNRISAAPFVIRYTVDRFSQQTLPLSVFPPSVALSSYPSFLGSVPSNAAESAAQSNYYFYLHSAVSEDGAVAYAESVRAKYPGIHLAILPPRMRQAFVGPSLESPKAPGIFYSDETWRVAMATAATRDEAMKAVALANRLGIGDGLDVVSIDLSEAKAWAPADRAQQQRQQEVRDKLSDCFKDQRVATWQDLVNCSSVIVTPKQLAGCLGEVEGWVPTSTVEIARTGYSQCAWFALGHEGLDALAAIGVSLEGAVTLDVDTFELVPDLKQLAECQKKANGSVDALQGCVAPTLFNEKQRAALDCLAGDRAKQMECISATLPEEQKKQAECLMSAGSATEAATTCLMSDEHRQALGTAETCLGAATSLDARNQCLGTLLGNDISEPVLCVTNAAGDPLKAAACLASDPKQRAILDGISCLEQAQKADSASAVVPRCSSVFGPEGAAALECMSGIANDDYAACLTDPRLSEAATALKCLSSVDDVASTIDNCAVGVGDAKTRTAISCAVRAGGDRDQLAGCAAAAILPGDLGKIAACYASSQGSTVGAAICAFGPKMNEEWRIAVECAVTNGGNPVGTVACTGGRLTLRELTKCLSGKFGSDCFGENNTIRKYYTDMASDLGDALNGKFNKNNEIVKVANVVVDGVKTLVDDWKRSDLNPSRALEGLSDSFSRSDLNPGNWSW